MLNFAFFAKRLLFWTRFLLIYANVFHVFLQTYFISVVHSAVFDQKSFSHFIKTVFLPFKVLVITRWEIFCIGKLKFKPQGEEKSNGNFAWGCKIYLILARTLLWMKMK